MSSRRTSAPSCSRDHELLELVDRLEVRSSRVRFSWTSCALGLTHGRERVVGGERLTHLAPGSRSSAAMRSGLQPGAEREGASAEDVRALDALDGRRRGWTTRIR